MRPAPYPDEPNVRSIQIASGAGWSIDDYVLVPHGRLDVCHDILEVGIAHIAARARLSIAEPAFMTDGCRYSEVEHRGGGSAAQIIVLCACRAGGIECHRFTSNWRGADAQPTFMIDRY